MAVKKSADTQDTAQEQAKLDVLSGIVDKEARTYTMQKTVAINGERREGMFVYHYPTVSDRIRQGIMQSQFLQGVPVESLDVVTYNIAYAMAFLASVTTQVPEWFRYEQMDSIDELQEMFVEVNDFVESFRSAYAAGADAASGKDAAGKEIVADS